MFANVRMASVCKQEATAHDNRNSLQSIGKMKYYMIFIWYSLALCKSGACFCQVFDKRAEVTFYCDSYSGPVSEDCSDSFLLQPSDVKGLIFRGCERNSINYAMEMCRNLRSLEIAYSDFKNFDWIDVGSRGVHKINVSHNELPHFPREFLNKFAELIEVDVSHNKIGTIYSSDFDTTFEFKWLDLSHNRIAHIGYRAFENLNELEYVDLSHNRIESGVDALRHNKHLKTLHLEMNPIRHFTCDDYFATNAVSVHISWEFVEYLLFQECGENKFSIVLDNEREAILPIANGKYEIYCGADSFEAVTTFMTEQNAIENVGELMQCFGSALTHMSVHSSRIEVEDTVPFERFINLEWLSLSNSSLAQFDFTWFKKQKKLRMLDISNNNLKHLNNIGYSESLENLSDFYAAGNQFEDLLNLLSSLKPSITSLDLSDNYIGAPSPMLFGRFDNLMRLKLRSTNLSIAHFNPFKLAKHLYILDISQNDIELINLTVLSDTLKKLFEFYAANCNIVNVLEVIRHLGPSLSHLDLSGNPIKEFNADTFKSLTNLHQLNLNNVDISHLEQDALRYHTRLTHFHMANNKLERIDFGVIMRELIDIDLNGNELTNIEHLDLEYFPNLLSIRLSRNRLSCRSLVQIAREWDGTLSDDSWDQKHGRDCRSQAELYFDLIDKNAS